MKVSILGLLVLLGINRAQVDKVQVVLPQVSRQAKDLSTVVDLEIADQVETEELGLDQEDERVEKSLLNTFPFNQRHQEHGDHQHDHGDHSGDHSGDHQADHHGDHHGDHHEDHHRDHHGEHHGEHHEENVHDETEKNPLRDPLSTRGPGSQFPFVLQTKIQGEESEATSINTIVSSGSPDSQGKKCIDKIMMTEETQFDEVITCDHSYDKRCHTSYVTTFQAHQEEECEENFKKVCMIEYESKAYNETLEICSTEIVKDCDKEGPTVCRTVYESSCATRNIEHEVEDDVTNCKTEQMVKCREVTEGYITKDQCEEWPVQRCSIERKVVKKFTPETKCWSEPKEICGTEGCGFKNVTSCRDEVKTIVVDHPVETCDMEPVTKCSFVSKIVPKLVPRQECTEVPKEVCSRSKTNPRKVKKPIIKKWCYTPSKQSGLL